MNNDRAAENKLQKNLYLLIIVYELFSKTITGRTGV